MIDCTDTIGCPNTDAIIKSMSRQLLNVFTSSELPIQSHETSQLFDENNDWSDPSLRSHITSDRLYTLIKNLNEDAQLTIECNVIAFIYIQKFLGLGGVSAVTRDNWRPIISTAFLIAAKVWDDTSMINKDWSILYRNWSTLPDVNRWEVAFLHVLDYKVNVTASKYTEMYFQLRNDTCVSRCWLKTAPKCSDSHAPLHNARNLCIKKISSKRTREGVRKETVSRRHSFDETSLTSGRRPSVKRPRRPHSCCIS